MPDGIAITPLDPRGPALRITIAPKDLAPHPREAEIDAAWDALCAENPRLFNGPLLSVIAVDAAANHITCRREGFKRLAVQRAEPAARSVHTGVHQLAVTGAILADDRAGVTHVLLGRRGAQTRLYGGLWELAPSGGIDPPSPGVTELTRDDVLRTLAKEAHEELGLELDTAAATIPLIIRDDHAASDDLVVVLRLAQTIDPRRPITCAAGDWEYADTSWLALPDAAAFAHDHADAVIPPTRALLGDLSWLPER